MNEDVILSKDALFHNRTDNMTLVQQCKFDAMLFINHIINCALTDDRERSSGKCIDMQYTYFLERIKHSFETTIHQNEVCHDIIVFDDFIRIADYCYVALKEIVASPSTHIEKMDTKMLANRAHGFGTKTMRWLSQRPGRTIDEKISPENKVLTTKTVFSADTKENREFMYLYNILHEAIIDRVQGTNCQYCTQNHNCGYYDWVRKVQRILSMNSKIATSDLASVKPIKQSYQNNKLMCDKNYKIVWDAVKMLSDLEDKISEDYNSNLSSRLAVIVYWVLLAKMLSMPYAKVTDSIGTVHDENGELWFGDSERRGFKDTVIVSNASGQLQTILQLSLTGSKIEIRKKNVVVFDFDVEQYFKNIDEIIAVETEAVQSGQSEGIV